MFTQKQQPQERKNAPFGLSDDKLQAKLLPKASYSLPSSDDMDIDDLTNSLSKVSLQEITRASLTNTNSNFLDLCNQLNHLKISEYRENMYKEADLIASRVENDLNLINKLHGEAKNSSEADRRLMIVHVFQTYKRCLELDIEKWKCELKLAGKSNSEIASINIFIPDFIPWQNREHCAPSYAEEKLAKPSGDTIVHKIAFVQSALNYWRSCYRNIREYEKLINAQPYDVEKQLWKLENTTMSYMSSRTDRKRVSDINYLRIREPSNIDPETGEPVSVEKIKYMIEKQQEQSGYKPRF